MKTHKFLPRLIAAATGLIVVGESYAAPVIYEPFDYSAGTINGTQSGATGTTGGWISSGNVTGNAFSIVSPGLSFTGLSTTGGAVRRPTAPGGSEISVGISSAAQAALLGDGTTIYFSLLYRNDRFSVGNDNLTFMIGSGAFTSNGTDGVIPNISGGEGFGVYTTARNNSSIMHVYGYAADNDGVSTTASVSSTSFNTGSTAVNTFMIVGRIDWAANGLDDTLTLYNIEDPGEEGSLVLPGSPFATMTADLDQSAFDTLAITDRQVGTFDEIRFGTTLADVGVTDGVAPEIVVKRDSANINTGGTQDFGTVTVGSNTSLVFTIANTGTADLTLTGTPPDYVEVAGANASDFTVTSQPSTPVTAGNNTTFTVQFAPGGAGSRSATVSIPNNDGNENPFTFTVTGTGEAVGGYAVWSGGEPFGGDKNSDGVSNGLAFLLGAANPDEDALDRLPVVTEDSGGLVLSFDCLNADNRGDSTLSVEHSSDLGASDAWLGALVPDVDGISGPVNGVTFIVTLGDPLNSVTATIESGEAANGKLFGRLEGAE